MNFFNRTHGLKKLSERKKKKAQYVRLKVVKQCKEMLKNISN